MGFEQTIISAIKELFYYDIWESLFLLILFLIETKIKIKINEIVFHTFMLSILNYIICNTVAIPIITQLSVALSIAIYTSLVYKLKLFKSIVVNIKTYFMLFVVETILAFIYSFFNINLLAINDDLKVLYMMPIKCIEIIFLIGYYKYKNMKGGVKDYD